MKTWKIDHDHSEIKFKVKHLLVSTVSGMFRNFDAVIRSNDDFKNAEILFEADIDSIDTKNDQRDAHLKSPDFFDAVNHPKLFFKSSSLRQIEGDRYELIGDLTIRSTTKEVNLNVIYNGTVEGFGGTKVAGFEISGKLNRMDYGLRWNGITEAGGVVVSDEVKLDIAAEFIQAQEQHQGQEQEKKQEAAV